MINWTEQAWEEYCYWQSQDKKTIKRINLLIQDIIRNGVSTGIGKPEPLMYDLQGFWSRRIDEFNRLVYTIDNNDSNSNVVIISCQYHYKK